MCVIITQEQLATSCELSHWKDLARLYFVGYQMGTIKSLEHLSSDVEFADLTFRCRQ